MSAKKRGAELAAPVADGQGEILAPILPYLPQNPKHYRPKIALIGCGGISGDHLRAYRKAGYDVALLCDIDLERARSRQQEFYPEAAVVDDFRAVFDSDAEVVDITIHPAERPALIEGAIRSGKHVLSQKPFVLDLEVGERLADLADEFGVRLAVNQNGRWAPHFSYLRHGVESGLVGQLSGVHFSVQWDHNWVVGTQFDQVRHLILYDFAIHWFDMLACLMGERQALRVYSSMTRSNTQQARPPLLAQSLVEYEGAQASLVFDGDIEFGSQNVTYVSGSGGTLISYGASTRSQRITYYSAAGVARPVLEGTWFPDGFHGTMGELLCAIEEDREPSNSARNNLRSLALCFAAVASAERHEPTIPGSIRRMPPEAL